jgi:hypothetical protein
MTQSKPLTQAKPRPQSTFKKIAAILLWLLTLVLAICDVYFSREVLFGIYARFSTAREPAIALGDIVLIFASIAAMAFIVWMSEYHLKHFGEHKSWDVFAWSLVVLLAIPFVATVVLNRAP